MFTMHQAVLQTNIMEFSQLFHTTDDAEFALLLQSELRPWSQSFSSPEKTGIGPYGCSIRHVNYYPK